MAVAILDEMQELNQKIAFPWLVTKQSLNVG
jgi:hypothetical protein